jgi:CBS domain-containing protein
MPTTVEQLLASKGHEYYFVRPDALIQQAVEQFTELNVGALLVCDGERLVGILSERDCVRRVMAKSKSANETRVSEVMTHTPICVSPNETTEQCMAIMTESRIRHLPVIRFGRIQGVISMGDAVHAILNEKEHLIEDLSGYIAGSPSVRPPVS